MTRSAFMAPPGFRDSPHMALSPGEVVASTYAVQRELGRTDSGVVFEAKDMLMERQVALKLGWRDPNTPPLLHEARRCAAVRDPCSVAVYGMGTHNGVNYVVGERVVGEMLATTIAGLTADRYLARLRKLVAAVARAHEFGVAVGDLSGATVLVDPSNRLILGRLSLSQVPAYGPLGQILAPEVVRGEVEANDPNAAAAIDLYGLGCVAIELAAGAPPFADPSPEVQLRGHAFEAPPRLGALRDDLPEELDGLVAWLLAKRPAARPRSADDVLAQLDAIIDRLGTSHRSARVLIVDDELSRARALWSVARRADAHALVETSTEGGDAAHKLNRDHPDLVIVDATLRGVMNALELVMYARGLDGDPPHVVIVGDLAAKDRALLDGPATTVAPRADVDDVVLDEVRAVVRGIAHEPPRKRGSRKTIRG